MTKGLVILATTHVSIYRGKRALLLLRVSTPYQEQNFGWQSQEQEIQGKFVNLLNLKVNKTKHICNIYTGLEFSERPELNRIVEMVKKKNLTLYVSMC